MNKRFKAKWVKALRSGDFKQARNHLKASDALCCIGVGYKVKTGRRPNFHMTATASSAIGLTVDQQERLIDLNDSFGADFNKIADWIEQHL